MKRANHLAIQAADPENLRLAFWKAKKGRSSSNEIALFRENLEGNLGVLREQILSGLVKVGKYRFFTIFDPKKRRICASAFSEQVLHHALMNVSHGRFERVQVYDSYACRRGKGTHAALARANYFTQYQDWFLKLDIRKFFDSVDHEVLKTQLARIFKDRQFLRILEKIIDSYAVNPGRGLPIGNLTSQYFANHYLTGLDHFTKEILRVKSYVRYMDDLVLWHNDASILKKARDNIREYVSNRLRCEMKPSLLNRIHHGLPFLGYRLQRNYVRLSQRSKRRFIRRMGDLDANFHSGQWSESECQRRALSLLSVARYANTRNFRKQVLENLQGQSARARIASFAAAAGSTIPGIAASPTATTTSRRIGTTISDSAWPSARSSRESRIASTEQPIVLSRPTKVQWAKRRARSHRAAVLVGIPPNVLLPFLA